MSYPTIPDLSLPGTSSAGGAAEVIEPLDVEVETDPIEVSVEVA
jgi:hypothetical protein